MNTFVRVRTSWPRRRWSVATALAAMAALAVGSVSYTSGASAPPPPAPRNHVVVPDAIEPTTYLAGYDVMPTRGLASASVTFTVPAATCTAADQADLADVFEGVSTTGTVTQQLTAGVRTMCSPSGMTLDADVATPAGNASKSGVSPGDTIVASMFQTSFNSWAEVHDLTNGSYWSATDPAFVDATTVDIGSQSRAGALPTFAKVAYANATVDGDYLGFNSVGGVTQCNLVIGGVTLMKPGPLTTTAGGTTFTVKFKNAS
jgi:hypothetical protein